MSHTWKVAALDYAVSQDGLSNVVTTVHWTCSKEDADGNAGSAYGSQGLGAPDADNFVAWDDITEATAISWCTAEMTAAAEEGADDPVAAVEAAIDAQIADQAAPTSGTGVPW